MNGAPSLYDKYLSNLTEEFCAVVKNSTAHRAAIDSFDLAISPFTNRSVVCVHRDGSLSLIGVVEEDDYELTALAMRQAGYEVGDPEECAGTPTIKHFKVPVSGIGCEFELRFSVLTTKD